MRILVTAFLLLLPLSAIAKTIAVVGTGLTGLWTAYSITKALQENPIDENVKVIVVGKWDWIEAQKDTTVFSHEASGFGPIGIQPHSGLLWNTDNEAVTLVKNGIGNPEASFYTSEHLEEEGWFFLDLYTGWHARHPDQLTDPASSYRRQEALIAINRYARKLWGEFYETLKSHPIDIHLEGAWRIYDDPVHFQNAVQSLRTLNDFSYPALTEENPTKLAEALPFYREAILRDQKQGVFFSDDGLIDSNQLRHFLWSYLTGDQHEKVQFSFYLDSEVDHLVMKGHSCKGVVLKNKAEVSSDITVLSMGLENKVLLAQNGWEIPMWSVWGAAVKAKLLQDLPEPPKGGVSFHSQRCITAAPDGKTMVIAGTSMVVSANEVPDPVLYQKKLTKNLNTLFAGKVDSSSLKFYAAPRPGIPDDLPIIGLEVPQIENLIVLNPTSHLGNTQSIALGKLASIQVLSTLGVGKNPFPVELNLTNYRLDRFSADIEFVRKERALGHSLLR